ncbi:hypothetical protein P7C71_g6208, partial [Lecanoromycetidae sp. Uapishka_2]
MAVEPAIQDLLDARVLFPGSGQLLAGPLDILGAVDSDMALDSEHTSEYVAETPLSGGPAQSLSPEPSIDASSDTNGDLGDENVMSDDNIEEESTTVARLAVDHTENSELEQAKFADRESSEEDLVDREEHVEGTEHCIEDKDEPSGEDHSEDDDMEAHLTPTVDAHELVDDGTPMEVELADHQYSEGDRMKDHNPTECADHPMEDDDSTEDEISDEEDDSVKAETFQDILKERPMHQSEWDWVKDALFRHGSLKNNAKYDQRDGYIRQRDMSEAPATWQNAAYEYAIRLSEVMVPATQIRGKAGQWR